MDKLRVGVIGAGGHAQVHFEMIAHEPEMDLVAVAEMNPERLAKAQEMYPPVQGFTEYREMLDICELDVVYVVTMPGHTVPIVLDCLERNLHTSVEKPAGMSSADAQRMLDGARKSKGKVIVSVNRRYKPEVLAVKRRVLERGGAVQVAATYNKPVTKVGTSAMAGLTPAPIICDAIHHVDLLRWLAGPALEKAADPVRVCADSWSGAREGSNRYNAVIGFDTGCNGVMMSHYGVGARIQQAEVHAEDFSVYMDLTGDPACEIYENGKVADNTLDLGAVGGLDFNETRHFVQCIREDKESWSTLEDMVKTMKLCEAIEQGHRGELWV
ncbi:MAG: Gfo/Idh/MocA family oxidoreductase [bacterium]|nr:Gfo/Idh/MocA family oxidoreductase [bacterium]